MSNEGNKDDNNSTQADPLLSDDSSSEASIDDSLKVSEEEKRGTIPGSTTATAMALAGTRAQTNPTVERGPPKRRKKLKVTKNHILNS